MKQRLLYVRVGLFVLTGCALLFGAVLALGLGQVFRPTFQAETYIDESVQGLDVGSAVRFRGVPVGQVSSIGFLTSTYPLPEDQRKFPLAARLVLVRIELEPSQLGGPLLGDPKAIQRMVDQGLRIRLASTGLTGVAYLEMSYFDPQRSPPLSLWWNPQSLYIPAAPSTITRFTESAEGIMRELEDARLRDLFESANQLLEQGTQLVTEVKEIAGAVRGGMAGQDLAGGVRDALAAVGELRAAGAEARQLVATLNRSLTSEDFAATVANLRAASAEAGQLVANLIRGLSPEALAATVADVQAVLGDVKAASSGVRTMVEQLSGAAGTDRIAGAIGDALAAVAALRVITQAAADEIPGALQQLRATLDGVAALTAELKATVPTQTLASILDNAQQSAESIKTGAAKLPQTMDSASRTLRRLGEVVASTQGDLNAIMENLRSVVENLRQLSATARAYPSQIPFGAPPPRIQYDGAR